MDAKKILSRWLCGFRKSHSTQHALFRLLAWQKAPVSSRYVATVFMDLSKLIYVCIPHNLLIAKLEEYDLDKTSLHLSRDYLSNWKQKTKLGCSLNDCWDVICGVPQGLILGLICLTFS